jgi:hypothetical protein
MSEADRAAEAERLRQEALVEARRLQTSGGLKVHGWKARFVSSTSIQGERGATKIDATSAQENGH